MSILDTFLIIFSSNAEEVQKGAEDATEAGKKLEDQLGSTGDAAADAADGITSSNADAADSFQDIADAVDDTVDAMGALPSAAEASTVAAAQSSTAQTASSKKVAEGHKEVGKEAKKAGEAVVEASKASEEALGEVGKAVEELKEGFHEFIGSVMEQTLEAVATLKALFAVEHVIDSFFENAEHNDQLGETAKSLGVNIEMLDAWGNAVKRVGGTAEGFQDSLKNLEFRIQRVALAGGKRGGPGGKFFEALGIDPAHAKEPFALLDQLSKKIEGMDHAKSGALLRGIGLDEGTIRLLQAGNKEVEELIEKQKRLGVTTKEDAEVAEAFNREWMDVKELFSNIVTDMDTEFLPILRDLLEIIEDVIVYLRDHKALVVGFFVALAAAALSAADAVGLLDLAVDILIAPIFLVGLAIGAVITVLALLYDDIVNFAEGNKSLTGEIAKHWAFFGEAIWALIDVFEDAWTMIKLGAIEVVSIIKQIPEGLRQWVTILGYVMDAVGKFINEVIAAFSTVPGPIGTIFKNLTSIIGDSIKGWGAFWHEHIDQVIELVKHLLTIFGSLGKLLIDIFVDPLHAFDNFGKTLGGEVAAIVKMMPDLTNAFQAVGTAFDAIGQTIIHLWEEIKNVIMGVIGNIETGASALLNLLSKIPGFASKAADPRNPTNPQTGETDAGLGEALRNTPTTGVEPGKPGYVPPVLSEVLPKKPAPQPDIPIEPLPPGEPAHTFAPLKPGQLPPWDTSEPAPASPPRSTPIIVSPGVAPVTVAPVVNVPPPTVLFPPQPPAPAPTPALPVQPQYRDFPAREVAAAHDLGGDIDRSGPLVAPGAKPAEPANVTTTNTTNVSVGNVTVNTQATDANGVAHDLAERLNEHYREIVNSQAASGVAY